MATHRGIEITAQNYRFLANHVSRYSDLYLTAEATLGRGGFARAARALLTVPEDFREAVETEGRITTNVQGGRYADGIEAVAAAWNAGQRTFPMTEMNRRMLGREQAARKRTGRFVPETPEQAFGSAAKSEPCRVCGIRGGGHTASCDYQPRRSRHYDNI